MKLLDITIDYTSGMIHGLAEGYCWMSDSVGDALETVQDFQVLFSPYKWKRIKQDAASFKVLYYFYLY